MCNNSSFPFTNKDISLRFAIDKSRKKDRKNKLFQC